VRLISTSAAAAAAVVVVVVVVVVVIVGPIPVAGRSKAWDCDRSLAGIAGSNSAGNMDVCLL
jgi:hypothetical protein